MTALTRSLRGRLVLGAVAVGLTFAVLFGLTAMWRIHRAEEPAIGAALANRLDLAREEVGADGTLRSDSANPKTDLVQIVGADGAVLASTAPLRGVRPLADPAVVGRSSGAVRGATTLQVPDVDLGTLAVPVQVVRNGHPQVVVLVVAVDTEGFTTANDGLTGLLVGGLAAVVVVLAALTWVVTGRALRSVSRLTDNAERVGSADLASGLPVPVDDAELSRLVHALNRMLARIHDAHATELAFAADAGHRLRTPVATLRAEAELALRDPDPDARTVALQQIITDADHLGLIIDRMLARTRGRSEEPRVVADLVAEGSRRWRRQAELAGVRVDVQVDPALPGVLRCDDVLDVVDPIVENAIRHSPPGEHVTVAVAAVDDHGGRARARVRLQVEVTNTGPPVPAELAPRIFDAWVSSRGGSEAGGLGLWIARETARDAGGEVTLGPSRPGRTTFRVDLPARDGAAAGPGVEGQMSASSR